MKNKKSLFVCVFASSLILTNSIIANADSIIDAGVLKKGLLGEKFDSDIQNYNTNNDRNVNVLDMCRVKKGILDNSPVIKETVKFKIGNVSVGSNGSTLIIPVVITGNSLGVSAVQMKVEYNSSYFTLENVRDGDIGGSVVYSKYNNNIQYLSPNTSNLTTEGNIFYMEFSVAQDVPYNEYEFVFTDIHASTLPSDGITRDLNSSECQERSNVSTVWFEHKPPVTNPTTSIIENDAEFYMTNAEMDSSSRKLRIPIYVTNNKLGISALSAKVSYDRNNFSLVNITTGSFGGFGYVTGNRDEAVFMANNMQNITASDGIIAYLEFDVLNDTNGEFDFELNNITAKYTENWNQKSLNVPSSLQYTYTYHNAQVTEPPVTTIVTAPWTTVITTEATTVPITTTVTTTTTAPVTTTVTTTTTAPVTTTVVTTTTGPVSEFREEQLWILEEINKYRSSHNMKNMDINLKACKAADMRSELLEQSYNAETLPDGRNFKWTLYDNNISPYCISQFIDTSATKEEMVSKYLNTAGSLLTNELFEYVGIGHYVGSDGRNYWTIFTLG